LATSLAWGKGAITKIVVESEALRVSVEIVDPAILEMFTIWSGPGVGGWDMLKTLPKPEDAKFIVDWTQGIVSGPPSASSRYSVRMYIEGRQSPQDTYEVEYVTGPADNPGYVYLPGYRDNFGRWNAFQISRGVEGNWFKATTEWEEVVQPLISRE
jgi:hypothetical protein